MLNFIQSIDDAVITAFNDLHSPIFNAFFAFFTTIGNSGAVWIVLGIVMLFFRKTRKPGITVLLSLLVGLIVINLFLKPTVARVRPFDAMNFELLIARPTDYSFPSGHAASSFEAAVSCLLWDKKIGAAAMVIAALVTFSRIYFQVHYISDIIAGALIGSAIAAAVYFLVKAVDKRIGIK